MFNINSNRFRHISTLFVSVSLFFFLLSGCVSTTGENSVKQIEEQTSGTDAVSKNHISYEIRNKINSSGYSPRISVQSKWITADSKLPSLYKNRNYAPLWVTKKGLLPQSAELIQIIQSSNEEALYPQDYYIRRIASVVNKYEAARAQNKLDTKSLAELELLLSNAFLSYARDMFYGRVSPERINLDLMYSETPKDISALLVTSVNSNNVANTLNSLKPQYPVYGRLKTALKKYRQLAANGEWPTVAGTTKFTKGSRGQRVLALRERLIITGELDESQRGIQVFDNTLDQAVRIYQERNGLYVDGVVGKSTIEYLNVSAQEHVRQIELSMERWRILPQNMGNRYVLVNIAQFHLYAIEHNRDALDMKIVVGKPKWNTPIFSEQMTHIVVNPYWNIPPSIYKDDIAPNLRADPNYLSDRNIQAVGLTMEQIEPAAGDIDTTPATASKETGDVVQTEEDLIKARQDAAKLAYNNKVLTGNYRLRQHPGPRNPLGRIKFLFPNKHSVYLHDTPNRGFFNRAQRNFSHGCIRVEKPIELADFVLAPDPSWDGNRVQSSINGGLSKTVHLPEPLAVYILYFTAWANANGDVSFHKDIYGLDQILENALNSSHAPYVDMADNTTQ